MRHTDCSLARVDLLLIPVAKLLAYHGFFRSAATILRHPHGGWELAHMGIRAVMGLGALLVAFWAHDLFGAAAFWIALYGARAVAWVGMASCVRSEVRRNVRWLPMLACGLLTNAALDVALLHACPSLAQVYP